MKYSKDKKVVFDPKYHTYHLGDKKLESVTSYIKRHTNIFDAEAVAKKYAAKHKLNADEVLAMWEKKGKDSRDAGTATHLVFEKYFETGKIEISGEYPKELIAKKFIEDFYLTGRLIPLEWEYIVYNEEKAGQLDNISKDEKDNHYIFDWKTNSEIKTDSWGRYMFSPYSKIPDASFYHYSLQTHLYKEMCKEYDIKKCFIVHIQDEDYQFLNPFKF